ncbi:hypothetical protein [Sphingobacterium sp. 40-24]|uniref:hypothetical protein n=1 Tax=Sphingobacterium sp. 40-24 TaxID=1895843 RepID=UPI00096752A6|nr:hypothetical protein [Sphingobacterium sp. 40-24]OJZ05788.1 MAG: hypothetical protein BGP15_01360 [Sphingobacterium sp. 40-24]
MKNRSFKFEDFGIAPDRNKIINYAVIIEFQIRNLIRISLGLFEEERVKSFGNSSQSLSFNQIVTLFIDLGGLSKDQGNLFIKFAEIRNKFAHSLECYSLSILFSKFAPDILKYLENRYKLKLDYEDNNNCWILIESQLKDIEEVLNSILNKMISNTFSITVRHTNSKLMELSKELLEDTDFLNSIQGKDKSELIRNFFIYVSSVHEDGKNDIDESTILRYNKLV